MLKNGSILNDRYEIIDVVGTGGMSDVYKAKCHKLNRYVAIKVLKQEYSMDKNFVTKFRGEAQSAAGLSNPNIVNVYDVGEDNGSHYIVMELVEGITLKAYIEKKGRLDVKESVSIAIQIAQGIKAAHEHHIIHRDIKPQNIIISKDGKVKVTDFGIARASSAQTINSNALGSVHYISPEQARGGYVDERSDIYSLGITLFEMLTGQVPFQSDTAVSVALMHIQNELPSPRNIEPGIPVSIEKIIFKCTQKRVDRRYADAGTLIEDLKAALLSINQGTAATVVASGDFSATSDDVLSVAGMSSTKSTTSSTDNKDKSTQRKKDFIEKLAADDKQKNPIIEKLITAATVLIALAIVILAVYSISLIKDNLTPPTIDPIVNETSSYESQLGVSNVEMPNLLDYLVGDAIIELNKINLKNKLTYEYNDTVEKDRVISQQYVAGTPLDRNTQVELVISKGEHEYSIPDCKDMTLEMVSDVITANDLIFSPVFVWDNEVPFGQVVKTSPSKDTIVRAGSTVVVYISKGTEFDVVTVPEITGKTQEEAKILLENAGLVLRDVNFVESTTVPEGLIITQSYLADTVLSIGTPVDVTISLGEPEPVIPTTSVVIQKSPFMRFITEEDNTFHKPIGPGSNSNIAYAYAVLTLELTFTDPDGNVVTRTIYSKDIKPDELPLELSGIEGMVGVADGNIKAYITIGETRYTTQGSYYVEFH